MVISSVWQRIVGAGVDKTHSVWFTHKLQNRNALCLLCSVFSLFYVFFFLQKELFLPLFAISLGISIFILSIWLNKLKQYDASSLLILINTNYCVLFFSVYLGFDSGIHLYLFTSPLIVLSFFYDRDKKFILLAMMSYFLNFLIILLIEKKFGFKIMALSPIEISLLYVTNFIFAILITITLSLSFIYSNEKTNDLLFISNTELNEENSIRRKTQEALQVTLNEQEILLSELHHRVKNNLAIISGLLNGQIEKLKDEESRLIFEKTKDRIYTMSLIHNQLYANKLFSKIEFDVYIANFCAHVNKNHHKSFSVLIKEDTEKIMLDIKTAMPCALILNELLSNSLNHAFKNVPAAIIEVGLKKNNTSTLFWVSDNGEGMDTKFLNAEGGGLSLVLSLIEQIDGKLTYENTEGSKFLIRFQSSS